MNNDRWTWIEAISLHLSLPNSAVSVILFCILFATFTFFSYNLISFKFNFPPLEFLYPISICPCPNCGIYNCSITYISIFPAMLPEFTIALSMSILISFEFYTINNLLNAYKEVIKNQKLNEKAHLTLDKWQSELRARFTQSYWYYIIAVSMVILVFFFIYLDYSNRGPLISFYFVEHSGNKLHPLLGAFLGGTFDIYTKGLYIATFYLLALIVWILINIFWFIVKLGSLVRRDVLWVNIISPDNFSGLNQLNGLVLKGFIYYSICITLTILTDPSFLGHSGITWMIISLAILFIIGSSFSFMSMMAIRSIRIHKLTEELQRLDENYRLHYNRFMEIVSNEDAERHKEDLERLSSVLKTLQEKKDRMLSDNRSRYDLKTFGAFLASFFLPIVSKILQDNIFKII